MIILAIDTSAAATVALLDGERVLASSTEHSARRHAEHLGTAVPDVIEQGPAPQLVVAGIGPGPFTGLRAGIATAIGFGIGRAVPVHGIPSHLGLALRALRDVPPDGAHPEGDVIIATDARRKEVYVTRAGGLDADGVPRVTAGPDVAAPADLGVQSGVRMGRGFALYPQLLGPPASDDPADLEPSAADLGRVAARMLAAGRELWGISPLYLRDPDARPAPPRVNPL